MRVSNVTVRRRLFTALIMGTVIFTALILRLAYVQLWIGQDLANKAEDSWRRKIEFAPKRGEIQDRNGITMTYSMSTPTIVAIPVQIQDARSTAAKLAEVLQGNEDDIYKQITKKTSQNDIKPSGRKITVEKAQEVRNLHLPGIVVAEDNKRYYPFGSLAAHILGFAGLDKGLTGIEAKYNSQLTGIAGSISYMTDAAGRTLEGTTDTYTKPKDGLNMKLTIDSHLQSVLERELDQAMVQYQAQNVIAIMMDPNNGEILAMGSRPTYEPGNYKDYPAETYNRNLPIWKTYEPGSTFKIITLAAALEEKKVDLKNEQFYDPGFIEVGGARLRCWKRGGHGSETMLQVVQNSCNPGFVVMGQRLGKEKLFDYISKFGFGKKTGIDLGGEENGIMFKPSQVGPVELATTAFGQGVSVTPIQQITAVSAAINGGKLFKPYVAKSFTNPDTGEIVDVVKPELVRNVVSEETSKQVREALESVVAKGTGRNAFIDGYRVGGKTGTAQKVINGRYSPDEHIVSFIGFAPADNPKIVIYAAVDDPQGIQFGGLIAAPLVKNMMADALRYMKVEPDKNQLDKDYRYGETPVVEVPDLVGASVDDILEDLNMNFRLAKSGSGKYVISQAPKPGSRVDQGSTIRIFLSNNAPPQ
ncbi:stage V sporulation protein D (sporulation-specific penicillin-binding protein) [Paenibacillus sp. V4I3]|uniref:stage V sporulation protein D n=1 Tax=unclassified Paenibacillus TaxID=185978 RepID=UPI002789DB82|nr:MULTISPECIES: stage V sporulation protein D [unclassified Paenibacillus]MDQ0876861.1 stage V sporulation protein D (sporulation-specific penicillin-binding protein) [Paenibacillus sp. V4I3]MDQ0887260.1 stage V sporulation protein D (sporulation-specific penicillin-binding protein) [Paenibacillus sp. V4I9]